MWPYLDGRLLIPYKEMVSVYISQSFIVLEPTQFMHYAQLHDIGSSTVNLDITVVPPVTSIRGLLKNRKLKRRRIPAFN